MSGLMVDVNSSVVIPSNLHDPYFVLLDGAHFDTREEPQFHERSHPSRKFQTLSLEERMLDNITKHMFIMQLEHEQKSEHYVEMQRFVLRHSIEVLFDDIENVLREIGIDMLNPCDQMLSYIPNNSFLVFGTHSDIQNAASDSTIVRWTGYLPIKVGHEFLRINRNKKGSLGLTVVSCPV